jgi:hypothetical protein
MIEISMRIAERGILLPLTAAYMNTHEQQREYRERGFLRESFALGDPTPLPQLCRDVAEFDRTLTEWQTRGHARVPYLFTAAIERITNDTAIRVVIEALLGTNAWVVWGPHILRETPQAASRWHVDLESQYWPSVTVAVGLSGCSAHSAIWCLPGTHLLTRTPAWSGDDSNTDRVLRSARRARPEVGQPEQFEAFGDGRFYVFDAKTWHRASAEAATNRLVLFLHYQPADARRVPLVLDYMRHRWSREAAAYLAGPGSQSASKVARVPLREQALAVVARLR